ncbi:MAG: DUF3135 domain-containing protein [Cellvibrionaceae bacterium]
MSDFPNFDQLLKLAKEQPEELEKFRQEQVELLINEAPANSQRRLRGLQFQIDAQRQLHEDSPMGACMKISQMMHESFAELRVWLNDITGLDDPLRNEINDFQSSGSEKVAAKVLPFPAS